MITFCQNATTDGLVTKDVANFYLPASSEDSISSNIVINGKRSPSFSNTGVREAWNRLLRGVGAYGAIGTSTSISATGFGLQAGSATIARSFAVIFDMEKMSMHSSTGEPMTSGGGLTVNIEGLGVTSGEYATKVFITAHHSGVLEIRDSGCSIYT